MLSPVNLHMRAQRVVAADQRQMAHSTGAWPQVGCTVAPVIVLGAVEGPPHGGLPGSATQ